MRPSLSILLVKVDTQGVFMHPQNCAWKSPKKRRAQTLMIVADRRTWTSCSSGTTTSSGSPSRGWPTSRRTRRPARLKGKKWLRQRRLAQRYFQFLKSYSYHDIVHLLKKVPWNLPKQVDETGSREEEEGGREMAATAVPPGQILRQAKSFDQMDPR